MSKYVGFRLGKVHESHVISEYYCGGCGWPVTDHDSFCPECGGAFRECDASNLEAENSKLRELVRRLISHVEHPPCEGCGFEMNCDGEHVTQCDEWLFMVADARELGVEVEG